MSSKNIELLDDFQEFCLDHPELRFWQALRAWVGPEYDVLLEDKDGVKHDTFYWEGKYN